MMKLLIILLALVLSAQHANAALLGWWKHDEPSGSLIDSLNAHPPGTVFGTPSYGEPGVPNGAYGAIVVNQAIGSSIRYDYSDLDEFFVIGTDNINPVMNLDATGAFTVMGWMNPAAPTQTLRTYRLLSTGSGAGGDRGWGFGLRLNDLSGIGSTIRFTTYGIADNDSSTFDVAIDTWIHLAATYSNGTISYFLNGNALDSDTSAFGNDGAAARLVVGARLGGNDVDQMNGLIDGIQVYNEVLTVDQIRQAASGSVSIPEPSSLALLMLGATALRRRRRSP